MIPSFLGCPRDADLSEERAGTPLSSAISSVTFAVILTTLTPLLSGCNDHPVASLEQNLSAVNRVESRLPAKTKLDFLFVIDNSSSMCEEQERLSKNFKLFSDFLFDELQDASDYRIAVVSTDLSPNNPTRGQYLYQPADPNTRSCNDVELVLNTQDCEPIGSGAPAIISSEDINALRDPNLSTDEQRASLKAELERQFRCRATLGANGSTFEKGMEAMRLALSCSGPNADKFAQCCVNYGQPDAYYNPGCVIPEGEAEPEFLRPNANLVVIFVSDEDDCSAPSDAPDQTSRLICRTGGTIDNNTNGVPDIYEAYCKGIGPQECYQRECGEYVTEGPQRCREQRCEVTESSNEACVWYRNRLSSISEYRNFLQSLKARPLDQLLVAPIVGFRTYSSEGDELRYTPQQAISDECVNERFTFNEECCLDGVCPGVRAFKPSCDLPTKGIKAFPGTRYLLLAESMGENALGCPAGAEPVVDTNAETIMSVPGQDPQACLNICLEDFVSPLEAIKNRVAKLLNTYCLDRLPACLVSEEGEQRPCEGAELDDPNNYPVKVSMRCTSERCEQTLPLTTLSRDAWSLNLGLGSCVAQVTLNTLPPAGAEVFVEFFIDAQNPDNLGSTESTESTESTNP
jgi:hypothetical protein